jgi:hypothetical protein
MAGLCMHRRVSCVGSRRLLDLRHAVRARVRGAKKAGAVELCDWLTRELDVKSLCEAQDNGTPVRRVTAEVM